MAHFDVFNGDADGLCALHQLRLSHPVPDAILVTGVKRDVSLLGRVPAGAGDEVTVLDVSLRENRAALMALLDDGTRVLYVDHHSAGDIPRHPGLTAWIDEAPDVCTSLLVDRHLDGAWRPWAVVAAYGDNLATVAARLAGALGWDVATRATMRELGECLNFNAYGETEADLVIHPAELYRRMRGHRDPRRFIEEEPVFDELRRRLGHDLADGARIAPRLSLPWGSVVVLPDEAWSRRVAGLLANRLAEAEPDRAHAILAPTVAGGYIVSVRSPRGGRPAHGLCRQFPGGGGRVGAGGINNLPPGRLDEFLGRFEAEFAPGPGGSASTAPGVGTDPA